MERILEGANTTGSSRLLVRSHIWVSGLVQGVAYRAFVWEAASRLGLRGGVRNLDDGRVALVVEGNRSEVERLLEELGVGPPLARVEDVQVQWGSATGEFKEFQVWR